MRPVLLAIALAALSPLVAAQAARSASAASENSGTTSATAAGGEAEAAAGRQAASGYERNADGEILFHNVLTGKPLDMTFRPGQEITPAVEQFRKSGENPYVGDEAAIDEGKKTYTQICAPCHLPDGTGRIGPSLVDDQWRHPGLDTEVGRFEIIYGGGAGAMQAMGKRLDQDTILKVMAYVDRLREEAAAK